MTKKMITKCTGKTDMSGFTGKKAAVSDFDSSLLLQPVGNTGGALTLRTIFPQYKDPISIQKEITASPQLSAIYHSWTLSRRQEFLDFCSGNRGIRILYDSYFKYVFNPDTHAAELSRMISVLIGQDVKIVQILPNESHLGADYTLVIMDIIVETANGSVVNVEVQKIGYNFPGERAACYNADLLLRQYQRIRKEYSESDTLEKSGKSGEKKVKFSYKYIRPVYTIVFMETSTEDFHRFPEDYVHTFCPVSDTGLKLNLLQNYIFVPLDIFRKHLDAVLYLPDDCLITEREAWLAFLSSDDPKIILRILDQFPGIFRPLYDRICTMCRNTKEMIYMFSEELSILDKNTVMMMIEEQQETIEQQKKELLQKEEAIEQQKQELSQKEEAIEQQKQELSQKEETIDMQKQEIELLLKELAEARK